MKIRFSLEPLRNVQNDLHPVRLRAPTLLRERLKNNNITYPSLALSEWRNWEMGVTVKPHWEEKDVRESSILSAVDRLKQLIGKLFFQNALHWSTLDCVSKTICLYYVCCINLL